MTTCPLWKQESDRYVDEAHHLAGCGKYEDALKRWAAALSVLQCEKVKFDVLVGRSRCYADYSAYLKSIPAAASECSARYALEPSQIARLGLADAERARQLQPDEPAAHLCRAQALLLLEEYAAAEEALLYTLSLDAHSSQAQEGLQNLRALQPHGTKRRKVDRSLDDFDCILCCKLLHKPVTTPCGHSFCQGCFAQAMDHGHNSCPMCRRVLHTGKDLPVTVALSNIISHSFPEESATRQTERASTSGHENGAASFSDIPVFVMASILPGETIALNIFEPRYRLMFRRCMEGNRKLAMTCALRDSHNSHFLPDIITECDITECNVQPDGRLSVQCLGKRRLHSTGDKELDGYRICAVDREVRDEPLDCAHGASPLPDPLVRLYESSAHVLRAITQQAEAADRPQRSAVLAHLAELGPLPDAATDPEGLTWWAARLLCVQARDKLQMLTMTSSPERACLLLSKMPTPARAGQGIIQMAMDGHGCSIM